VIKIELRSLSFLAKIGLVLPSPAARNLGLSEEVGGTTYIACLAAMTFYATATLMGNSVGENTIRKTRVDNSEPARKACFRGSSATNGLTIAPACYGSELERSEPQQIFRV
jgi:hypothetical protein